MRGMIRIALLALALPALASAGAMAAGGQSFDRIARGRYLAVVGDCAGCHTAPDGTPYAGGKPLETPFGTMLGSNLTPDRETGIGAWSDEEFVRALRKGIGRNGKHLYPAMPYPHYTRMSRDDVLAVRAFLNTLPPVRHKVVANQLAFPFNVRAAMRAWNALYFTSGRYQPVAGKSAQWNRGGYLVEGPAHCGMCHTPRTSLGGEDSGHRLQGGVLEGWLAPDLTADPRIGLGAWSEAEIVTYLKTGHNAVAAASGPMAEVVQNSTSRMSDADLRAMAVYLKDQPAPQRAKPQPVAAGDPAMQAGAQVYADACSACHRAGGEGVAGLFPTLAGSPAVQQDQPRNLIHVLLSGAPSAATARAPTAPAMPAFAWKLSDRQAAAVLTYIRNSWGNAARPVTAGDVHDQRTTAARQ